jgi:copper transport protein
MHASMISEHPNPPFEPNRRRRAASSGLPSWTSIVFVLVLVSLAPESLHAHTELAWSRPAAGDTVTGSPAELRLRFTTPVEPRFTVARLYGADGGEFALPAATDVDERREFVVPVERTLYDGIYTVRWRTTAADGHVIEGEFEFVVAGVPEPAVGPDAPGEEPAPVQPAAPPPAEPAAALGAAIRFAHFAALIGLVGAIVFRLGVLGGAAPAPAGAVGAAAAERVRMLALGAWALLVAALAARLWLQSATLHGVAGATADGALGATLGTSWGRAWLIKALGGAIAGAGVILAGRDGLRIAGWGVAALGATGLVLGLPLSGHASTVEGALGTVAIVNDAAHVAAASGWIGALAVLVLAGVPAAWAAGPGARGRAAAELVHRFSPVALVAAALVVTTGLVNALIFLGSPAELWGTDWGRVLIIKVLVLLPVLGLGAYHWRRVRPGLGTDEAATAFRRTAAIELMIGAVVVLMTAILVATPRP